jgi:cell division transport system permease protein
MPKIQASRGDRKKKGDGNYSQRNSYQQSSDFKKPKNSSTQIKSRPNKKGFSSGFKHHQQVSVDSLHRLFLEPTASLLTWAVIGIALAFPLSLLLALQNLQQFGSDLDDASQISLFMEMSTSNLELEEQRELILQRADVNAVVIISSQQALEEFQLVSGFSDVLNGLDENPLPPVLVISPGTQIVSETETLLAELQTIEGVEFAQFDLEWLQRLHGIIDIARRITLLLAASLCLGVILVVGNTVRLTIENRRSEIVVVKLVGGTDAYVSRPFLYTGFWYGVGGGLFAWLLVQIGLLGLQGPVSGLAGLYDKSFTLAGLDVFEILVLLLGGGLLGWIGAWLSVLRHLKQIEPG